MLDHAQKGENIVIERSGVRFNLTAAEPRTPQKRENLIVAVDEAVLAGQWTWTLGDDGLELELGDEADKGS